LRQLQRQRTHRDGHGAAGEHVGHGGLHALQVVGGGGDVLVLRVGHGVARVGAGGRAAGRGELREGEGRGGREEARITQGGRGKWSGALPAEWEAASHTSRNGCGRGPGSWRQLTHLRRGARGVLRVGDVVLADLEGVGVAGAAVSHLVVARTRHHAGLREPAPGCTGGGGGGQGEEGRGSG